MSWISIQFESLTQNKIIIFYMWSNGFSFYFHMLYHWKSSFSCEENLSTEQKSVCACFRVIRTNSLLQRLASNRMYFCEMWKYLFLVKCSYIFFGEPTKLQYHFHYISEQFESFPIIKQFVCLRFINIFTVVEQIVDWALQHWA